MNKTIIKIINGIIGISILIAIGIIIYSQVREHYQEKDPKIVELVNKLYPIFNQTKKSCHDENLLDSIPILPGKKSFSVNKRKIHLCLRDENKNYYDDNMLIYALLHELAHCICDEIGHTEKWKSIFIDLQKLAAQYGVFDPDKELVENYCGHD
jgi:hypothetical protein